MSAGITGPADTLVPIAVVGPTATGKSDLGLDLAEALGGEIVNIDAMQQYRGMDIGTAKLAPEERRGIPHHQLDVLDVTETATVARYQQAAIADVEAILGRGRLPIVVGGSMMYVQALLDEWQFPATDPQVRAKWRRSSRPRGSQRSTGRCRAPIPPPRRRSCHRRPPHGRALEVVELTGQPFAASQPTIGEPRWGTVILGVDRDTAELDDRIARRTDLMFERGLVDEVHGLLEVGLHEGVTARRAIGYAQVLAYIDGEYDLDHARERTFIGTRRYVRRQRSWFRRDPRIHWLDGADPDLLDVARRAVQDARTSPASPAR